MEYIQNLFERYVDAGITFVNKKCIQLMPQVTIAKVQALFNLLESLLLLQVGAPNLNQEPNKINPLVCMNFIFAYVWCIGGNISENNWDAFDSFVRSLFEDNGDARVNAC